MQIVSKKLTRKNYAKYEEKKNYIMKLLIIKFKCPRHINELSI